MRSKAGSMKINAYAKINLGLDISAKREDGYHELKTIFLEIALNDEIELAPLPQKGIFLSCSDETLCEEKENTVYKAAELIFKRYKIQGGIKIHIEKRIPAGAGLGGGSSDAAATLKALNEIYSLGIGISELEGYGALIGADVPFFIRGGAALGQKKGEYLTPLASIKLPPLLLALPRDVSVSTKLAYAEADKEKELIHPDIDALLKALCENDFEGICANAGNSFERPVFRLYPKIKKLKELLLDTGAGACVMSGSGSSLFALYKTNAEAERAAEVMRKKNEAVKTFLFTAPNC